MEDRYIKLQFVSIPDGAIPAFRRDPIDERDIYVYRDDHRWVPFFCSKTILVPLLEVCPHYFRKPHEYRVWHEHFLEEFLSPLRGEGYLTLCHRKGLPSMFGLAWSKYPLELKYRGTLKEPPVWWEAEDLWAEVHDFHTLKRDLEEATLLEDRRWEERQDLYRLQVELGEIEPPRRETPEQRQARIRNLRNAVRAALRG